MKACDVHAESVLLQNELHSTAKPDKIWPRTRTKTAQVYDSTNRRFTVILWWLTPLPPDVGHPTFENQRDNDSLNLVLHFVNATIRFNFTGGASLSLDLIFSTVGAL